MGTSVFPQDRFHVECIQLNEAELTFVHGIYIWGSICTVQYTHNFRLNRVTALILYPLLLTNSTLIQHGAKAPETRKKRSQLHVLTLKKSRPLARYSLGLETFGLAGGFCGFLPGTGTGRLSMFEVCNPKSCDLNHDIPI